MKTLADHLSENRTKAFAKSLSSIAELKKVLEEAISDASEWKQRAQEAEKKLAAIRSDERVPLWVREMAEQRGEGA